ncbi:MAG: hypothetical protein ACE5HV_16360, partial [Acidobacteriota bacterium]
MAEAFPLRLFSFCSLLWVCLGAWAAPGSESLGYGLERLSGVPAQTQPSSHQRPLRIRVAYAPELRNRPAWFAKFKCAAAKASTILEPVIGRQLQVEGKVPWLRVAKWDSLPALRADLVREIDAEGADIVVGLALAAASEEFQSEPNAFLPVEEGIAHYYRGYVVLAVRRPDLCRLSRLLAHEIGHLFGGVHRRGENYLMGMGHLGTKIDALNAELFSLHRGRRFGNRTPPLGREDLRMMWRLSEASLDSPRTWLVLGVLAAHMGKHEAAAAYYETALGYCDTAAEAEPACGVACVNLGHEHAKLGK